MVRRNGKFVKSQRMIEISQLIAKTLPDGVDYEKLVTLLEFEGYREDTARRYIDTVLKIKGWIIIDGTIKSFEEEEKELE